MSVEHPRKSPTVAEGTKEEAVPIFRRSQHRSGDPDLEQFHRSMAASEAGPAVEPEDPDRFSPAEYAGIVTWMREAYDGGRFEAVWARRLDFGYGVGESHMSGDDFFWFNALPALAALKCGQRDHPAVAMCAGRAEQATNRADQAQSDAVKEINDRYFG